MSVKTPSCVVLWILSLTLFDPGLSHGSAPFPDSYTASGEILPLRGTATLSRYFIKGCDIAFYSVNPDKESVLSEDASRCLEFYYYRDVSAEQLGRAAWDILNDAWSPALLEEHKDAINKLNGLYIAVKKGDRYRLVYHAGKGTELLLNGESLGVVPGAKMSTLYFSIWLGEKPLDVGLRDKLFGF